jgi:hypothetical protein
MSLKHGLTRNNTGEGGFESSLKFRSVGSEHHSHAWARLMPARPVKPILLNFFNLVSYILYIVVIFELYVIK